MFVTGARSNDTPRNRRGITADSERARAWLRRWGRQRQGEAVLVCTSSTNPAAVAQVIGAAAAQASKRPGSTKFMNFGYSARKVSVVLVSGPLRCLAMMISASPSCSESSRL